MATDKMPDLGVANNALDNAASFNANVYNRAESRPDDPVLGLVPAPDRKSALSEFQRLDSRIDYRPGQNRQIVSRCEKCRKWVFNGVLRSVVIRARDGTEIDQIICPTCIGGIRRTQTRSAAKRFNIEPKRILFLTHVFRTTFKSADAKRAIFRNHSIGLDDVLRLWINQDGKCALTGRAMKTYHPADSNLGIANLDRIDSRRGYDPDNIQWVCWAVNLMKQNLASEEFVRWCRRVALFAQMSAQPSTEPR